MTDKDVPFTNNLAGQALHKANFKQNISGGFRTARDARMFFSIRSYLATMHKQQANLSYFLGSIFKGQPALSSLAG